MNDSIAVSEVITSETDELVLAHTNENLLELVLSGRGGKIQVDTSCTGCSLDTLNIVEFPVYSPPINSGNMLFFASASDYKNFILAANLMEDLWKYSNVDFEDTPLELYHLGEESFNAFDSAMQFTSLRSIYELNSFYNYDWKDTALIYVEDDDIQIVLNELNEVKIGNKYYKYVNNNILAEINDNLSTLDSVRTWGIFAHGSSNLRLYDELKDSIISKLEWQEVVQGCTDFHLGLTGNISSYINSSYSRWTINTSVLNPITGTNSSKYKNEKSKLYNRLGGWNC